MDLPEIALSIRQPYTELILAGHKKCEKRTIPTKRRGLILLYSPQTVEDDLDAERLLGIKVDSLPTGVLVGTVEIATCERADDLWLWQLINPRRIKPLKPKRQPQPIWFRPF